MKLGLLTAALPRLTLDRTAAWAAGNGFERTEDLAKRGFLLACDVLRPYLV